MVWRSVIAGSLALGLLSCGPAGRPTVEAPVAIVAPGDLGGEAIDADRETLQLGKATKCVNHAKVTKKIAGKVVKKALDRYGIKELVTEDEVKLAKKRMGKFLRWKLGGSMAVCGQWVTAGQKHFNKAYSDEGGAMALGILDFDKEKPEFLLPSWMIQYIKGEVKDASEKEIAKFLVEEVGLPQLIADELARKAASVVASGVPRTVGFYMPKGYDIENKVVEKAVEIRKKTSPVAVDFSKVPTKSVGVEDEGEEAEPD